MSSERGDSPAPSALHAFVEAILGAAIVCDPETLAIEAVNERATGLLGFDAGTLTLMGVVDLGDRPEAIDGDPVADRLRRLPGTDDRARFEWTVEANDHGRRRLAVTAHATPVAGAERLVIGLTDATGRARAEHELRTQQRLTEAMAEVVPGSLFLLDDSGTLSRWNDRLVEDTGYDGPELSARSLTDLVAEDDRDALSETLADVYRRGEVATCEVLLVTRDGGRVPYRLTVGPASGTELAGAVGVGEGLTESTFREERLAVLTRVLRHNFRNELNVITGFTQQALNDVDDPTTERQLERVVDTAGRLLRAGETSRKIERLLSDRPEPRSMSLSGAVEEALASLPADLLGDADVHVDAPTDATVEAAGRFPDAIAELVDNAVRHNDADRPSVRIVASRLPSDEWVSLVIADDGPGLPPTERAVLTGTETQLEHGSGLGLWYVNWIVSAGGGSLAIPETADEGTRIELQLPVADDPDPD